MGKVERNPFFSDEHCKYEKQPTLVHIVVPRFLLHNCQSKQFCRRSHVAPQPQPVLGVAPCLDRFRSLSVSFVQWLYDDGHGAMAHDTSAAANQNAEVPGTPGNILLLSFTLISSSQKF